MATVEVDLGEDAEIFLDETKLIVFTVKDPLGTVVDVGGMTFLFEVRLTRYTLGPPLFSVVPTLHTAGGDDGKVDVPLNLSALNAPLLKPGSFRYGMARTNGWDVQADGLFLVQRSAVHAP